LVIVGGLDIALEATSKLKNTLGFDVCIEIMKNILREVGLGSIDKVSKQALSAKNVKKKLEFSKMHKDWTICDWKRVVFSNETKINCLCSHGMTWCWICNKKNLPTRAILQTINTVDI
jgi:hypothetical protein